MADVITNMKVRFGADTKQFKKGMDDGKRAVQGFRKDAGSALESFANQFGVSLGPLAGTLNKATLATKGLSAGMKGAATSSNVFSKALQLLKVALISTGIGAIIVALGSLISYFTKTQRGADSVSKVFKAIGAVVNVFVDRLSGLGESLVKVFSDPKQAVSDLWEAIKTNIVNRFQGILQLFQTVGSGMKALWERDWDALKEAAAKSVQDIVQINTGLDANQQQNFAKGIKGITDEIKNEASAAYDLEAARQKLRDQEIALIEVQAKRNKQINEARLLAEDETVAADKRLAAMRNAQALEQKTLNENQALQRERIRILEEEIALGESTSEDYRQLAEEKAKLFDIESASLRLQKRLQTEVNSLTNEINAETAAIIKQREELTKDFKPLESQKLDLGIELNTGLETDKLTSWAQSLSEALEPAKTVIVDFAETFNATFEGLAENFAASIGQMMTGAGGFDDLSKTILASLGGLAVQAGKVIMKAGLAFFAIGEAFQAAISNPATALLAVAAGAALVAAGSALQSSLTNIASGGGGTFTSNAGVFDNTAGSGSNLSNNNYSPRAQTIKVELSGEARIGHDAIYVGYNKAKVLEGMGIGQIGSHGY